MISTAVRATIFFTVLTGVAYPLLITGVAKVVFPEKAQGSLITRDGVLLGSDLIGQKFETPGYFWSRASGTDYNPLPSGGTNSGPTSADLKAKIEERAKAGRTGDLLTASASGLDPHISWASARDQEERIAREHRLTLRQVDDLLAQNAESRQWGVFGEPRVNVLRLNLALERLVKEAGGHASSSER